MSPRELAMLAIGASNVPPWRVGLILAELSPRELAMLAIGAWHVPSSWQYLRASHLERVVYR